MAPDIYGLQPLARLAALLLVLLALPAAALQVDIRGNEYLSSREVRRLLSPPDDAAPPEAELQAWGEEAVYRLRDRYAKSGYFEADVALAVAGDGEVDPPRVEITIAEGPRYSFGPVRLELPDSVPALVQVEQLKARTGDPFDRDIPMQDRRAIERAYGNSGFVHVRVEELRDIRRTPKNVAVTYRIAPGRAVVFDTLLIRNVRAVASDTAPGIVDRDLVRSLLELDRGDTVRLRSMDRFSEKLRSTGAFTYVRLRDSLLSDSVSSALRLSVAERVPGNLQASAFVESQSGFGLEGRIAHRNILGRFNEARLGASLAQHRQGLSAGYGTPLLFGTLLRYDNDLSAIWTQEEWQRDLGLEAADNLFQGNLDVINTSAFSRSFRYWLRTRSAAELKWQDQLNPDGSREGTANLNAVNTVFITFLDQMLDPVRGSRFAFTWGNGGPMYRREKIALLDRHNWFEAQSAWYYPLHSTVRVAARLDGGLFWGSDSVNSRNFYLGGQRNVRSFPLRDLCPEKDTVVAVQNGRPVSSRVCRSREIEPAYTLASLELRLSPFRWFLEEDTGVSRHLRMLQVVPFVDYGLVWKARQFPGFQGLRRFAEGREEPLPFAEARQPSSGGGYFYGEGLALGLGLRYPLLGIFNLRVDYARGPDAYGIMHSAWAIDLAQAF